MFVTVRRPLSLPHFTSFSSGSYPSGQATVKFIPIFTAPTIRLFAILLPSPMNAILRPLKVPLYSLIVMRSASTWQGWQ